MSQFPATSNAGLIAFAAIDEILPGLIKAGVITDADPKAFWLRLAAKLDSPSNFHGQQAARDIRTVTQS